MPALPGWFGGRRLASRPLSPVRPSSRVPVAGADPTPSLEQARQAPVRERLPAGLAGRAVVERRVGERHFSHDVTADRAGLAGPTVHPHAQLLLRLQVTG